MKEVKTGKLCLQLLLVIKINLILHFTECQSSHLKDIAAERPERHESMDKDETAEKETLNTSFVSFLDAIVKASEKKEKPFRKFLSYYQRKVYPDKINSTSTIGRALDRHIEGMEPQFKSASFQQLWHALKEPLTDVMRPKRVGSLLSDLKRCNLSDAIALYDLPSDIDSIKRDLAICRIGETLHQNDTELSISKESRKKNYAQLWRLLKDRLSRTFQIAELSLLMSALWRCLPRFELAGIQYNMPSRMSEVQRDVLICNIDDAFNEVHDDDDLGGSGENTNAKLLWFMT